MYLRGRNPNITSELSVFVAAQFLLYVVSKDGVVWVILVPRLCYYPHVSLDGSYLPTSLQVVSLSLLDCWLWEHMVLHLGHHGVHQVHGCSFAIHHFIFWLPCSAYTACCTGPISVHLKFRSQTLSFSLVLGHVLQDPAESIFKELSFSKCN